MKARFRDRPGFQRWAPRLPIFDEIMAEEALWPEAAVWPRRRAEAVLRRFRAVYPSIDYDVAWNTRLMNAQAFFGERGRSVRLYGGLGRHRRVGVGGIAFAVAHEVGHHLGGAPRHEFYTTISSEARANAWAVEEGLPAVFGAAIAARFAAQGIGQLAAAWTKYQRLAPNV